MKSIYLGFAIGSVFTFFRHPLNAQTVPGDSISSAALPEEVIMVEEGTVVIPPLFEYVIAPDELPDLRSKTDYLMDNFWNPFDFKNTTAVDQNALNHAFLVYVETMPHASEKKVMDSVKKLIGNIKNNPGLTYQFAKAAEEALYGPRSEFWADDIYVQFLQNIVDNKKISEGRKAKYVRQLNLITSTSIGKKLPDFAVTGSHGNTMRIVPNKEFTLIGFQPAECSDCRYSNLKLDISAVINDLMENGTLDVMMVGIGDNMPVGMPDKWNILRTGDISDKLDMRISPCFYLIDKDGVIRGKNLSVDRAISLLEILTNESENI